MAGEENDEMVIENDDSTTNTNISVSESEMEKNELKEDNFNSFENNRIDQEKKDYVDDTTANNNIKKECNDDSDTASNAIHKKYLVNDAESSNPESLLIPVSTVSDSRPKKRRPLSLQPVPSFVDQDYRRALMLQNDLQHVSAHSNRQNLMAAATERYNRAHRESDSLAASRRVIERSLSDLVYKRQMRENKERNERVMKEAVAKARLERETGDINRRNSFSNGVRTNDNERNLIKGVLGSIVDRAIARSHPPQFAIGTPSTSRIIRSNVLSWKYMSAATLAHTIDAVVRRETDRQEHQTKGLQEREKVANNFTYATTISLTKSMCHGQTPSSKAFHPDGLSSSSSNNAFGLGTGVNSDHLKIEQLQVNSNNDESKSEGDPAVVAAERQEAELRKDLELKVGKLRSSEIERKIAWEKYVKIKGEFELLNQSSHTGQGKSGNKGGSTADLANVAMPPLKDWSVSTGGSPYTQGTQSRYKSPSSSAFSARPGRGRGAPRTAARILLSPDQSGSHPSKYSADKVKARIFSDGSVMPVSTPKRTKDGLFMRPAGRQRKGMDWDAVNGKWVPTGTAPTVQR